MPNSRFFWILGFYAFSRKGEKGEKKGKLFYGYSITLILLHIILFCY
jgi:hypothetical protein